MDQGLPVIPSVTVHEKRRHPPVHAGAHQGLKGLQNVSEGT